MRGTLLLGCVVCAFLLVQVVHCNAPAPPACSGVQCQRPPNEKTQICYIVRTYWGHGSLYGGGLARLLDSLIAQNYTRWEAVLVVLDSKPFLDLHHLLAQLGDDRIWVYAEWVAPQYVPKVRGEWSNGYHGTLYNLTDLAVRACHVDTDWLVITNGDNEYAQGVNQLLHEASGKYEVVAMDYYSRYQRATGEPCMRFAAGPRLPPCKVNHMVWCKTDLGATAYSWPRIIDDDMRFGLLTVYENFTGQDGLMASTVKERNWSVLHIHDRCLFDHNPSPQSCARRGGVWDDHDPATHRTVGGTCLTREEADQLLKQGMGKYEEIEVELSHTDMSVWQGGESHPPSIKCIRKKGDEAKTELVRFFGRQCAEDCDLGVLQDFMEQQGLYQPHHSSAVNPFEAAPGVKPPKIPPLEGSSLDTTRAMIDGPSKLLRKTQYRYGRSQSS